MSRKMAAVAGTILFMLSAPSLAQDRSSCLEAKDYLKAVKACSEIIRSDPKDASAYHMRGIVLAKNGDLGQAIADYSKAIEIDPRFAAAYNSRAEAYVAKGDYAHAVADVTKAGEVGSRKAQPVKAKMVVKPKPKVMRAAAKAIDTEPREPPFSPFPK
jgi:Flp pilus assembly protein TadD